jgi:hypothetical protein
MTTREKIINESIIRIEKRLSEIAKINDANPISDLIAIREEAQKLLEENTTIQERTSNEFIAKIEILSKKEKRCIKLAEENTGQKMVDLMDERIKLEFELRDLNNEKYYIKRSNVS